ncbi:unnamed protein product, partial [Pelagomonas calceolata]
VIRVVRKSLDVRKKLPEPRWTYVVDVECAGASLSSRALRAARGFDRSARARHGHEEEAHCRRRRLGPRGPLRGAAARLRRLRRDTDRARASPSSAAAATSAGSWRGASSRRSRTFALARAARARRRRTWSDGKLTTRIGRNSGDVRAVLRTFVRHGAPSEILTQGAPHLGTDGLIGILKSLRGQLTELGVDLRFGTRLLGLETENNESALASRATIHADAVVCAAGHSADDVYDALEAAGAKLEAKPVAVGFRVEHPQSLVNGLAYGDLACRVVTGNSRTDKANLLRHPTDEALSRDSEALLPVAAYRLAADVGDHSIYSFCMCPGGQVVPALTKPSEMVVNGMSYSRRHSLFANAALVVSVATDDPCLDQTKGARRVLAFQRSLERKAALLGGGDYVCPVQRLTDFVDKKAPRQRPPPASSYRLGVREASLHDGLLPDPLADALRAAATGAFERSMPGFVGDDAILHGVETRTSAPLRVVRNAECESVSLKNLYPCGEGAGYAGASCRGRRRARVARAVIG